MDEWTPEAESEYADFCRAQEQEERELREAEEVLNWHLMYLAQPREVNR